MTFWRRFTLPRRPPVSPTPSPPPEPLFPRPSATPPSPILDLPLPAPPPPDLPVHAASLENIRLVIWDLDDTFWQGTLEEGGVTLIDRNVDILRTLSARGIVNSIASKNHLDRVREVLQQHDLWDLFALPQIAFQPKGELVRAVIESCQLRAASVLFIDDNTINLNEVAHYNPGIQIALPDVLPTLLADPRAQGAPDPGLKRLAQYKLLERRAADRAPLQSDNTAFLRQSEIRVSIHHDVISAFDRVHDLVNRTNQLNFTKHRLPAEIDVARAEMHQALTAEYNCHAAYIKVADKYGYYGICGFYMLRNYRVEHLLFSCRILNMGVEQLIYHKMGRPHVDVAGKVVADLNEPLVVDWISIVDDAEGKCEQASPHLPQQVICLRGGCELSQTAHYLRERYVVAEEFPYANGVWGIQTPLTDFVALNKLYLDSTLSRIFSQPWFDPKVMQSLVFSQAADIYILAFGGEPYVFRYKHTKSGVIMPLWLDSLDMADLTKLSYNEASVKSGLGISEDDWEWMQAEFELAFRFDAAYFETNLNALFDLLADKRIIVILSNSKHGRFVNINEMNACVSDVVLRVSANRMISTISFDDIIADDSEVLEMNHFRRDVYMRLSDRIRQELLSPDKPRPSNGPSTSVRIKANLLPSHDTVADQHWSPMNGAETVEANMIGKVTGEAVLQHRLVRSTDFHTFFAYGCLLSGSLMPGETYCASVWVWIPTGFSGGEVSICCAGLPSLTISRASLYLRDGWQQAWVTTQVPLDQSSLHPALCILGTAGDVVYSTAWKLEQAILPTGYVRSDVT